MACLRIFCGACHGWYMFSVKSTTPSSSTSAYTGKERLSTLLSPEPVQLPPVEMLSHQPLIVPALLLVLSTLTPCLASPSPMAYAGPMSDKQDGWHPVTNTTDSFSPYASPVANANATSAAGSPGSASGPKGGEGVYTNTLSGKELVGLVLTFVVLFLLVAGIGVWCFLKQHWSRARGSARSARQDDVAERGAMGGGKEGWEKIRDRVDGGGVPKICVEGPVGPASASMGSVGSSTMDVLEQRGYANTTAQVHQI